LVNHESTITDGLGRMSLIPPKNVEVETGETASTMVVYPA
ncbi:MAG: hypothetical protein ACI9VI_002069, partial [Candidatus Azotimanducaceae bacterium]